MHFGPIRKTYCLMLLLSLALAFGCNDKTTNYITFQEPLQGESFNVGKLVIVALDIPAETEVSAITYLIDGNEFAKANNKDSVILNTENLSLGYRVITAIVNSNGKSDTVTSNIILKTDQAPQKLGYKIINTFPHDTSSYTQGLSFVDGKLLESTGRKGLSVVKYTTLTTGKTLTKTDLAAEYFGEGSVKIGNKVIVLTWQEMVGLVYDATTLKKIGSFPYQNSREGWCLTYNGTQLLKSDGTNRIWYLNPQNYAEERYIEVYDHNGAVNELNELEYINGKIFANIYGSTKMVVIDPKTGAVTAEVDLKDLVPKNYFNSDDERQNNVLNGIAWDPINDRLFVTGKKWPNLYEIKIN